MIAAAVPSPTSPAHAWGLGWGGWDWGGVTVGLAPDGTGFGYAANVYGPPYDHAYGTDYGHPAVSYGYGTGYSTQSTGVTDTLLITPPLGTPSLAVCGVIRNKKADQ
jgi:hypothetical protein